ncbi:hypothetical protein AB7Y92_01260 [Providencia manganoxydans]|uniref:hypothetical protein n=1 Tax=Providencia manganoxydans TaxID=2923283 RepID=UPI0034DCEA3E
MKKLFMASSLILSFWLWWVINDYEKLTQKYTLLNHQLLVQQFIFDINLKLSSKINDIANHNLLQKEAAIIYSERNKQIIKETFFHNECATQLVPSDAANRLRQHSQRIYSNTSSQYP